MKKNYISLNQQKKIVYPISLLTTSLQFQSKSICDEYVCRGVPSKHDIERIKTFVNIFDIKNLFKKKNVDITKTFHNIEKDNQWISLSDV